MGDEGNVLATFDHMINIIIGFFSVFIYDVIREFGSHAEITLSILIFFALWVLFCQFYKAYVPTLRAVRRNERWRAVIDDLLDFVTKLLLFLLVRVLLVNLEESMRFSDLNLIETLVVIFVVLIAGFTFFEYAKSLILRTPPPRHE